MSRLSVTEIKQQQYDTLQRKVQEGRILSKKELLALATLEQDLQAAEPGDMVFDGIEAVMQYSGYGKSTVYNSIEAGILVQQSDGSFLQDDVDAWLDAKGRQPAQVSLPTGQVGQPGKDEDYAEDDEDLAEKNASLAMEDAKYRFWRAKRERLLVEKMRGEWIERGEVERANVNRCVEFRRALELLSRKIGHSMAAEFGVESKRVCSLIDVEARQILLDMTRPLRIEDKA